MAIAVTISITLLTGGVMLFVLREISIQNQQQKILVATESWYRQIIEYAPEGIMVLDAQGNIILANTSIEKLFGYSQTELIGQSIALLGLAELLQQSLHLLQEGEDVGPTCPLDQEEFEILGTRYDGSEFPIEVSLTSLPSLSQREMNIFASVRDISARQEAQQQILRQREHLQSVLDSAPVGVAITVNGITQFANPHIGELVDLKVGDSPQKIYVDLGDRQQMLEELTQFGRSQSRVYKMYNPEGKSGTFWLPF
ncbi:PAS domain S-box protein [Synechocystis sp. B12]|nr:PAS domain S-box protein [Synechocystis sp. B12]